MSKKSLASLGIVAFVLVVGVILFSGGNNENPPALSIIPTVYAQSDDFTYETFTEERYNALRGNEAFAVFFHSRSCGTCAKKHQQIVDEVEEFSGGTILKLEFDEADASLLQELNVIKYDTFVVFDENGNPMTIPGAGVNDVRDAIDGSHMDEMEAMEDEDSMEMEEEVDEDEEDEEDEA